MTSARGFEIDPRHRVQLGPFNAGGIPVASPTWHRSDLAAPPPLPPPSGKLGHGLLTFPSSFVALKPKAHFLPDGTRIFTDSDACKRDRSGFCSGAEVRERERESFSVGAKELVANTS